MEYHFSWIAGCVQKTDGLWKIFLLFLSLSIKNTVSPLFVCIVTGHPLNRPLANKAEDCGKKLKPSSILDLYCMCVHDIYTQWSKHIIKNHLTETSFKNTTLYPVCSEVPHYTQFAVRYLFHWNSNITPSILRTALLSLNTCS